MLVPWRVSLKHMSFFTAGCVFFIPITSLANQAPERTVGRQANRLAAQYVFVVEMVDWWYTICIYIFMMSTYFYRYVCIIYMIVFTFDTCLYF